MAKVSVIGPSGEHVEVDQSELSGLGEDYRLESDAAKAERLRIESRSDLRHTAAAGAAGLIKGLSLGYSDVAIDAMGGGDELRDIYAANPIASGAGELTGVVAPAFMSGGGSLLARLAARTPAGMAARLGNAIAGGGSSMLRMGAAAAVEGGIYGSGQYFSEAALQNKDFSAEALLASMGTGALTGGGIGLGIGGAGKLLARGVRGGSNLMSRALTKASDGSSGSLARVFEMTTGKSADDFARVFGSKDARFIAANADNIIASKTDDALRLAEQRFSARQTLMSELTGAGKVDKIRKGLNHSNVNAQSAALTGYADEVLSRVDDMLVKGSGYERKGLKKLREIAEATRENAAKAVRAGDDASTKLHTLADELKREVGRLQYGSKYAGKRGALNTLERATHDALDSMYQRGRTMLESSDIWGRGAAGMQKEVNAAWHELIKKGDIAGLDKHMGRMAKGANGRPTMVFDKERAAGFFRRLRSEHGDIRLAEVMDQLGAEAEIGKVMSSLPGASDKAKAAAQTLAKQGSAMRTSLEGAKTAAELGAAKRALSNDASMGNLIQSGVAYGIGAGLVNPTAGAAVAGGMAVLRNPAGMLQRIVAVEQMTSSIAKKLGTGSKGLFKSLGPNVARATHRVAATAEGAIKRHKNQRERYEQAKANVEYLANNRDQVAEQIKQTLAPIEQAAPGVAGLALQKELAKADYLQRHLPTSELPRSPFELPPVASKVEMQSFLRRLDIVEDPMMSLDLLEQGRLTHEHVDALKSVYPAIYTEMQNSVMTGLSDAQAKGKTVPYARRLQMGVLLEMPTDATLSPEVINMCQGIYGQEQTPEAADAAQEGGKAPDLSGAFKTDSERLESQEV